MRATPAVWLGSSSAWLQDSAAAVRRRRVTSLAAASSASAAPPHSARTRGSWLHSWPRTSQPALWAVGREARQEQGKASCVRKMEGCRQV
jgi:hypothetical protein